MTTTVTLEQLAAQGIIVAPATPVAAPVPAMPVATPVAASGKTPWQEVLALLFAKEWDATYRPYPTKASLGEMMASKTWTASRPGDGKAGNHYPAIYALSEAEASALVPILQTLADKPKSSTSRSRNYQRQAAAPQAAGGLTAEMVAQIVAQQLAAAGVYGEPQAAPVPPATPVTPPEGFTMVGNGEAVVTLVPGQIVAILGELRQVTEDGKRLRKTIA